MKPEKRTPGFLVNLFTLTLINLQQERCKIRSAALLTGLQQFPGALEQNLNRRVELPRFRVPGCEGSSFLMSFVGLP